MKYKKVIFNDNVIYNTKTNTVYFDFQTEFDDYKKWSNNYKNLEKQIIQDVINKKLWNYGQGHSKVINNETYYSEYFENGTLYLVFSKNLYDKLNGSYFKFHSNGKPYIKCFYDNGELDGIYLKFHSNGELQEKTFYKKGLIDGESKIYNLKGNLHFLKQYENGNLIKVQEFYNDILLNESFFNNENNKEIKTFFHFNGNKRKKIIYINKKIEGDVVTFTEDNFIDNIETYKNGKIIGKKEYFFKSNKIKREFYFKNDKLHGKFSEYFDNENLMSYGILENDKMVGWWSFFYKSGYLNCKVNFDKGIPIEYKYFLENQKIF